MHQDKDKICSVEDQQVFFFNHVYEGIKKFLQEIYLCTIVAVPDHFTPDPFCKWFKMVLDVDTVNGRKKVNFKDETSVNNEKKVSNMMKEKKIPIEIESMVKISSKDNGKAVVIEMIDCQVKKKSGLPNFGTFFAVNISPALKYYLKTLWDGTRSTNL